MMHAKTWPAVWIGWVAFSTCLGAGPDRRVVEALQARAYHEAITAVDQVLPQSRGSERETLLYLRGLALLNMGAYEETLRSFTEQLEAFPEGRWANKARFRKADAHVALKQFAEAEQIYADGVRKLLGEGRKADIAAVYLKFAEEYFTPPDSLTPPNYFQAKTFYERALDLDPGDSLRDTLLYKRALCEHKLGDWSASTEQYEEYLVVFDPAYRALEKQRLGQVALPKAARQAGAHIVEARLGLAQCMYGAGDLVGARRVCRDLLAQLSKQSAGNAGHHETAIEATYLLAKTYEMPHPRDIDAYLLGVGVLEKLMERWPSSMQAIRGALDVGEAAAHLGHSEEAIAAYRALIDRDTIRPDTDETRTLAEELSQEALFQIGLVYFRQTKFADAIREWKLYIATYPAGGHWAQAQQAIVDAEFGVGDAAYNEERYDDAREAWTRFLQDYPLDKRAAWIVLQFGEMAWEEQVALEKDGKSANWHAPLPHWRRVVGKFPGTDEAGWAQFRIGYLLEEKLHDLEGAIEAYKKLTWSSHARAAAQRVAKMQETKLSVRTARSFRTDEPVRVHVETRNIDKLMVKLYRIDMEDYFRKSHTLGGIESLDLLLIDPDESFEVPVEDYTAYKPIKRDVEIPFDGPGVYAVNISNETGEQDPPGGGPIRRVEATTLVVRSDIDVVIISSLRQVMVFAENMRTLTPAGGVDVLVSDGQKIRLIGTTGADGVWMAESEDLEDLDKLSVLATKEGHIAGNALHLDGLHLSSGLEARGYLYTDRPAYKPGEAVNIRGILREVKDGSYCLPEMPEDERLGWKLDVMDVKGRVLTTEPIVLGALGTFATQFRVAEDAPTGRYKLMARRAEGPSFAGGFLVQDYELPTAVLECVFDEPVVMRGDPITGHLKAMYHYGEPVVGKTVEYTMLLWPGGQLNRVGVTDEEGKIAFSFDSTLFPEEGVVNIQARQADLGLNTSAMAMIAVRAFHVDVRTVRQSAVYLSDEPVEVTIETKDLNGEPIGKTMTLAAFLIASESEQQAETEVDRVEVQTDAQTGIERATLTLSKGGEYVLRATGEDRFGHTVSGESYISISDDEDETKLRLFSDRQHFKVGEKIELSVHSRLDEKTSPSGVDGAVAPLALVTYEGEHIIGYHTVRLLPGHNPLEIPVENSHFPNFSVSVVVMEPGTTHDVGNSPDRRGRIHTAERGFTVERELNITLTPDKDSYHPREKLSLDITVTDQLGHPVAAEVGLAMIDNALLSRFPDTTPNITQFFKHGAFRYGAFRIETSCTFHYRAKTRAMVTELLAERRREVAETVARAARRSRGRPDAAALAPVASPAESVDFDYTGRVEDGNVSLGTTFYVSDEKSNLQGAVFSRGGGAGGGGQGVFGGGGPMAQQMQAGEDFEEGQVVLYSMHTSSSNGLVSEMDTKQMLKPRQKREIIDKLACIADSANRGYAGIEELTRLTSEVLRKAPPRTYFPDVAYWNPRIVTDTDGKAKVTIIMPDSSTTWKLVARGVTTETLVGRGDAEVLSKHDFFVELLTPPTLVEGDTFKPRALVHCLTPHTGKVDVVLQRRPIEPEPDPADGRHWLQQTRTIDIAGTGTFEVEFPELCMNRPGDFVFDLKARSQGVPADKDGRVLSDATVHTLPVRPWGMPIEAHKAGVGRDSDYVEIELPTDGTYHDRQLTIAVGPSIERWLIEEALERGPRWHYIEHQLASSRIAPPRTHADTVSALLGCLYAADYAASRSEPGTADAQVLHDRIVGLIAQLLAAQSEDGSWPWCGKSSTADPWTSANAAWAIGKAKSRGYPVSDSAVAKLRAYVHQTFVGADPNQYELKATALHGLSWLEEVDFAHVNRLHRSRETLSNAALGHLALTFVRLDRTSAAAEVLAVLQRRMNRKGGPEPTCWLSNAGHSAWMNSELEVTALALLAQLSVDPREESVPKMVAYLTASARADGWRPHKARGMVLAALTTYHSRNTPPDADYTLAIAVNGKRVRQLVSNEGGSVRIDLGGEDLRPGAQRIDFSLAGRGAYAYAITMRGFSAKYPKFRRDVLLAKDRAIAPPPLEYKGRVVDRGFGVAREYDWFCNRADHLPVGDVASVSVRLYRYDPSEQAAGDRDYVIVKETVPAGCRLLEETIRGDFVAHDYAGNVLTLFYGARPGLGTLRYEMVATTPGTYKLPPTMIQSLYRPDVVHVNDSGRVLAVLPRDTVSEDPYRMTPDELYQLGRLNFDDEHHDAAAAYLKELVEGDWLLDDEPYRESIRMLLGTALARNDQAAIVNYFEISQERYPDLVLSFDQIVRVAQAYADTGQHERAYLVYRATADASFVRDSAVGGTLQDEGRLLESVDYLTDLWRVYPDTPQVESTYYAIAQSLAAQASNAGALRPRQRDLAEGHKYVTADMVTHEAIDMLEWFLTLYPQSPVADEASYSLASAYLQLGAFDTVIARAKLYADRFPDSKWLDRFRYVRALALFNMGQFDEACALAKLVAESTYIDERGVEQPSPNKWLALYIIGQILHAQNRTAEAIEYYKQVRDRYSDADEAVNFFTHKYVRLPEVTIYHPDEHGFREADAWRRHLQAARLDAHQAASPQEGGPNDALLLAAPEVRIDYRNIKSAVLQVYAVDLLKLALIEKDLTKITAVNLAGIKPIVEREVRLGDGQDFEDKSRLVVLEGLRSSAGAKEGDKPSRAAGAYLVICRGDDLFTSGLVLVTPMAIEVQEDVASRRARVNVVNAITRKGRRDVHLEVIGTGMEQFVSGETDLRGLFIADGIMGYPTAVARDADGCFAFYRSDKATAEATELAKAILGVESGASQGRMRGVKQEIIAPPAGSKADYFSNVVDDNRQFQSMNQSALEGMFKKQKKGVSVQSTH